MEAIPCPALEHAVTGIISTNLTYVKTAGQAAFDEWRLALSCASCYPAGREWAEPAEGSVFRMLWL